MSRSKAPGITATLLKETQGQRATRLDIASGARYRRRVTIDAMRDDLALKRELEEWPA